MKNFFQLLATNIKLAISKAFSYPLTISILIILFFCIVYFVTTFTRGFGFEKMAGRMNTDIAYSEKTRDSLIDNNKPINYCTQALSNQYYFIKRYKQQHFDLAQQFETNYYAFVLILAISAVVSSILAISIGRTGWQNQSPAMRAAFFGFFFCTSLSGVFIKVFNCAENADKNVTKYFYFTNLQTNIYNVLACTDSLQKRCIDSTLLKVYCENNKNMKENMNLFLDIKADQIPTTDLKSVVVTKQKSN